MQDMEHTIRERAYHMWNDAGRPDGAADAFWLGAQREVLAQSLSQIASVTTPAKKKDKAKASSRKRRAA